jgi:hypothetical protein
VHLAFTDCCGKRAVSGNRVVWSVVGVGNPHQHSVSREQVLAIV